MQYIIFLILAPIAALASAGTIIVSTIYRKQARFITLRVFLCSQFLFLIGNTLELILPTESGTLFFAKLNYLFIAGGPVLWFLFSMEYAGFRAWLRPVPVVLVSAIPVMTFGFAACNDFLHLIWKEYRFEPVLGMLVMKVSEYGPWLWVHFAYCYVLMILGGFAIFAKYMQSHSFYRKQSALIIVGVIVPLAFNFIYLLKLIPGLTKDFSPVSFGLGGVCFAVGILRFRLSNATPVSRSELIEGLNDGFLVVDRENRILDLNAAATRFFGSDGNRLIGTDIAQLFPAWGAECLPRDGERLRKCVPEYRVRGIAGRVDMTVSAIPGERGGPTAYQAIFRIGNGVPSSDSVGPESEDTGPRPFLRIDSSGRIRASGQLAAVLDYPEDRLTGRRAGDIMMERLPFESGMLDGVVPLTLLRSTGEAVRVKASLSPCAGDGPGERDIRLTVIDMRFPREAFSIRENQIIGLLAEGLTNKEIGEKLFVSENTIKAHLKSMYRKVGANRRSHFLHVVTGEVGK